MSSTTTSSPAPARQNRAVRLGAIGGDWLDQRVGGAGLVRFFARKIFPDHWSFMFGEVALYSFVILLISGAFLTMFFVPSMDQVTYNGIYGPLQGMQMSKAFESTLHLSFEVRGGLRLIPGWESTIFGYVFSWNMLIPLGFYAIFLAALALWPFLEAWVTGDKREHHVLDLPYNAPTRTAFGVAWIVEYFILCLAATNDLLAVALHLSINDLTWLYRIAFFVAPVITFIVVKRLCLAIQRHKRELALHGKETSKVVRMENGEMLEIHEPLSDYERWVLVSHDTYRPLKAGKGVSSLRAKMSSFFFKDSVEPVTAAELRHALEHGAHESHKIDALISGDGSHAAH